MLAYRYRAVNAQGQIMQGVMPAQHQAQVAQHVAERGYELLSCKPQQGRQLHYRRAPDHQQLKLLFAQLAALAEAGVPLAVCLDDAAATLPDSLLRDALRDVVQRMRSGADFVTACAAWPRVFSRSVLAVLQGGMASGNPALAFGKARDHAAWQAELGATMRRATRYPFFLLALTIGVISFMMLFVVPQLVEFLKALDYALPWHSRVLIWLAEQFAFLWWLLPLFAAASVAAIMVGRRQAPRFADWCDGIMLRLPFLGDLIRQREMALFLHHLALLIGGGVPLLTALGSAQASLSNRAMQTQAGRMIAAVTAGQDLATAWQNTPVLSGTIARRVQIGLQSGNLAAQLQQASAECDAATIARSKQLIGALEPALTLIVGLMLAWIVLAVLGPLYGALNTLGSNR